MCLRFQVNKSRPKVCITVRNKRESLNLLYNYIYLVEGFRKSNIWPLLKNVLTHLWEKIWYRLSVNSGWKCEFDTSTSAKLLPVYKIHTHSHCCHSVAAYGKVRKMHSYVWQKPSSIPRWYANLCRRLGYANADYDDTVGTWKFELTPTHMNEWNNLCNFMHPPPHTHAIHPRLITLCFSKKVYWNQRESVLHST